MTDALLVPYFSAAVFLGVAGLEKLYKPTFAREMLRAIRLPDTNSVIRTFGFVELAVAILAVVGMLRGYPLMIAGLCVAYLLFSVVVLRLLRMGVPVRSCGCLGALDTPPSYLHVAFNATCATVAGASATGRASPIHLDVYAWPIVAVAVVVTVYLARALLAYLPVVWPMRNVSTTG